MTMTMCFIHGKLSIRQCAEVLVNTFFTNLMWCLFFVWFLAYKTHLFKSEPYLSQVQSVGLGKMGLDFDACVLKGIGANSLVCIGVILAYMARSDLGKVVLIFIPIATFATIGTFITATLFYHIMYCYRLYCFHQYDFNFEKYRY